MTWNDNYKIAEKYYKEHGNLNVPANYCMDGVNLSNWIITQRRIRKGTLANRKTPLTDEQIQRLDAIGMIWQPVGAKWEWAFAVAESYYREHGNLSVPKNYEQDGVNLSHWIWAQRRSYLRTVDRLNMDTAADINANMDTDSGMDAAAGSNTGKKLTEEQIRRLESIGMDWAPKAKGFSYYYEMAKQFYDAYGHTDFPKGAVEINGEILAESGEALSTWKADQQQKFTEKKYDMKWEHIMKMREIGIISQEALSPWEKNYRAAEAYYKEHGDLLVPFSYRNEDGIRLGRWISTQRMKRNGTAANALTEEQIRRLDAIEMVWNILH